MAIDLLYLSDNRITATVVDQSAVALPGAVVTLTILDRKGEVVLDIDGNPAPSWPVTMTDQADGTYTYDTDDRLLNKGWKYAGMVNVAFGGLNRHARVPINVPEDNK
jgi:hypothetical protein